MGWDDPEDRLSDPTANEFSRWVGHAEAFSRFEKKGIPDGLIATIARRLRGAELYAAATKASWVDPDTGKQMRRGITSIDPRWWSGGLKGDLRNVLEYGDATFVVRDPSGIGNVTVNFFGVKFEWSGLNEVVPRLSASAVLAPTPRQEVKGILGSDVFRPERKQIEALNSRVAELEAAAVTPAPPLTDLDSLPNKGGRPRAEFWDDLIIEMIRRIYEGEFKPKNQAEVVNAMQDWVAEHGYTGGLTQMKPVAAKILKTFK